ncbi:MAG TPA: hypothetical protein PLI06_04285 [Methanofastidiosum sp.]|nr:hypothetical protein [Methanofastidiosum sp.]
MPKTPLEYCPICNCFYYDITEKKLCPHEKDYPHAEINEPFINKAKIIDHSVKIGILYKQFQSWWN